MPVLAGLLRLAPVAAVAVCTMPAESSAMIWARMSAMSFSSAAFWAAISVLMSTASFC